MSHSTNQENQPYRPAELITAASVPSQHVDKPTPISADEYARRICVLHPAKSFAESVAAYSAAVGISKRTMYNRRNAKLIGGEVLNALLWAELQKTIADSAANWGNWHGQVINGADLPNNIAELASDSAELSHELDLPA